MKRGKITHQPSSVLFITIFYIQTQMHTYTDSYMYTNKKIMNVSYIWTYHAHVLSVLATPSLHTFSNPKTTQNMRFGQTYIGSNDFWKSILVVNGIELQWIQWNRQMALHSAHRHEIHFKIVYNWKCVEFQARIKINCFISHVMACIFGVKRKRRHIQLF